MNNNLWKILAIALIWGGAVILLILNKEFPYPGWLILLSLIVTGQVVTYGEEKEKPE